MKFGAIIRSCGERTESLCISAIGKRVSCDNIDIVKNRFPFHNAVELMIKLAIEKKYDWYIGIDADVVLMNNWWKTVEDALLNTKDIDSYFKLDFLLQDRFVKPYIYGLHLYNGKYNSKMLKILETTKSTSKAEGNIRHKIDANFMNFNSKPVGYHGFEQYYREIINRFAVRSFRNPEDIRRFSLFQEAGRDNQAGLFGWIYGLKHKDTVLKLLDARNKISASEFGFKEKSSLKMDLNEFLKKAKKYDFQKL